MEIMAHATSMEIRQNTKFHLEAVPTKTKVVTLTPVRREVGAPHILVNSVIWKPFQFNVWNDIFRYRSIRMSSFIILNISFLFKIIFLVPEAVR